VNIEQLLRGLYASFNARDIDGVLAAIAADVEWPNAWEGGRLHGRDAVREYWLRQWATIDPYVEPVAITALPDGRVAVDVHQVVRTPAGELITDQRVVHVYEVSGELVTRMSVEASHPEGRVAAPRRSVGDQRRSHG
jgi:hypothetical protein